MTPALVFCKGSCRLTISDGAMHRTVQGGVVPRLSEEWILRYRDFANVPNKPPPEWSFMKGKRFFLVSRDGREIEPFAWYFPFAGQWGAYCPFRCMRKRSVPDVSDLRDVVVEIIDFAEWENSEPMKCEN